MNGNTVMDLRDDVAERRDPESYNLPANVINSTPASRWRKIRKGRKLADNGPDSIEQMRAIKLPEVV